MNKIAIFLSFVVTLCTGCDPHDDRLTFTNNSVDTIIHIINDSSEFNQRFPIKYDSGTTNILMDRSSLLLPNSTINPLMSGKSGWEDFINMQCETRVLRVFFFTKPFITETPWDSIVAKQLYSKKYELNIDELEKINWRLTYP